jgi:multidrug efflux pump subunit AcrA (membrane-fusion protein)
MLESTTIPPPRKSQLVLRSMAEMDQYIVKNGAAGSFYELGDETYFLLKQLDGQHTVDDICAAFQQQFGKPLFRDELNEFIQMSRDMGFINASAGPAASPSQKPDTVHDAPAPITPAPAAALASSPPTAPARKPNLFQNLLHWRLRLVDPNRLFTWLAPLIWFFWTPVFLFVSLGSIVAALGIVWAHRQTLAGNIASSLTLESAVYAWLTLLVVTVLHECAHGLTCKHYGGDVHDMGFLLIFLMPAFYCNVSDAWLFKEKSKRLWVTLAGGYFELFLWSLSVFIWRLTLPGTQVNHLAYVVLSVTGIQVLFNFNPLLKLDGYYLLSDWLVIPNLRQRGLEYLMSHVRWLLWGAARPEPASRGQLLLIYGLISWLYSVCFLALMLFGLAHFGQRWGLLGMGGMLLLAVLSLRGVFQGFAAGEVEQMLLTRPQRTAAWCVAALSVPLVLIFGHIDDWAGERFQVRPATHVEVRAPIAGFVQMVYREEGEAVIPNTVVACLEVPDLASRTSQKQAEVQEAEARLRLMEAGPRPEELYEQRQRVERARGFRDQGAQALERARQALECDLKRLDEQIAEHRAQLELHENILERSKRLKGARAVPEEEIRASEFQVTAARSKQSQAQSQKSARLALGTQEAESELSRREKELADARSTLTLLEAGNRPEAIDAERARLARLKLEAAYLEHLQRKVRIVSPVAGVIATPHLKEKVGQFVREGDLIALIEEPAALEVEIALPEQEVARIQPGQPVALKARALPFETIPARVERIAPSANKGDVQNTLTVYCRVEGDHAGLKPGMSGHARIYTGERSLGGILLDRALRHLRTEFWW